VKNGGGVFMQNRCPRCNSKIPISRFLFPVVVFGYNNIDDNVYICGKCSAYIDWTRNRKFTVLLSYMFSIFYLFIGGSIVSSGWFLKVFLPGVIIPALVLLFFPKQIKVR
jgi:DNA-directed RNA polymerase subunit RPC12/RpoP